jgi:hypothetical protein
MFFTHYYIIMFTQQVKFLLSVHYFSMKFSWAGSHGKIMGVGWNVTPLVSGVSQQVFAVGLGCLLMAVESVAVTNCWLPCMT